MMRKLFFQTTVFIFFAFSLVACRNETEALKNENSSENKKHNQISLTDFKNQTNIANLEKHLSLELKKDKDHQSDDIFNSFQIDSATIYQLKVNPNVTTYSFRVYHRFQDPRNVYNLVFKKNGNLVEFSLLHIKATGIFKIFSSQDHLLNEPHHPNRNEDCEMSYTLFHCKNGLGSDRCDGCADCVTTVCVGSGGGSNGGGYDGGYYNPNTGNNNGIPEGGSPSAIFTDPSGYIFDPNVPPTIDPEYVRASRAYTFFMQLDGISYQAKEWANNHPDIYCLILENYLNKWTVGNNQQNLDFANWAIEFLMNNPDTLDAENFINRINALDVAIKQNSDFLLDTPCTELPKWKQLANYQILQSVKNRVNQINSQAGLFDSASLQSIFTGGGPSLNMDYFAVKINTLPNKPGTSQQYTPSEFFDHFRKNINNFVYGSSFTPVVNGGYNINDTALWNSSNPLGALIHIEIPGNNGTVICSEFNNQQWIFTTVDIPWDDQHPVSGNRRFGYYMEGGAMYVYARGVDRFTFNFLNYSATWFAEGIGFNKADELWSSFQTKISQFVNNGGGQSVIIPSTKYRPSWIKIRNYIKGTETISALGCH